MKSLRSDDPRLAELLEAVPALVAVTSPDTGRIAYANSHWLKFLGTDRAGLAKRSIYDVYATPADRDRLVTLLREHGSVEGYEAAFRHAGGTQRVGRLTAQMVLWDGEPAVMSVTADVTDQTRMKVALEESERRYARLSALTSEGILIVKGARCLDANPALARMTGFDAAEMAGKPWPELLAPEYRDEAWHYVAAGEERPIVVSVLRKDGSAFVAEMESRGALEGTGVHAVALRDITRRRQAEQAMVGAMEDLASVLDAMRNTVITMDGSGVVRSFNRAAEEAFGFLAGEVVGQPVTMLMPPDLAGEHQDHVERYKTTGVGPVIGRGREVLAQRKDGSTFPAHLSVAEMPPAADGTRRFVGSLFDITDIKASERTLVEAKLNAEAANRAKSRFLAVLNHELRTPLNAVIGFSQLLEMTQDRPDAANGRMQYVRCIRENGETLLRMLNDMMEYAHLEFGRRTIAMDEVALGDLFDAALSMVANRAGEKRIPLRVEPHDRAARIFGDRAGLIHILGGLLDNAIKFTPEGGTVALVSRRLPDGRLEFEVADTGIGMEPDQLERIFVPFDTQEPLLTRGHDGLGIGLAIAKNLVELHKGTIRAASTPGVGSTFTVTLPGRV